MSAPGPSSMKSLQKRLYTVLPRVASSSSQTVSSPPRLRSNSASRSFYTANSFPAVDSPPSRPTSISPPGSRLVIEAKPEVEGGSHAHNHAQSQLSHPSNSLALTSPQSNFNSSAFLLATHNALSSYPPYSALPSTASSYGLDVDAAAAPLSHTKKRRLRYQFDVGAYGIPKRCRPPDRINGTGIGCSNGSGRSLSSMDHDFGLSVQVGEDAYFVRDDAMGVADGVGGWARVKNSGPTLPLSAQTPSALFSRRLMHYCSSEVASAHSNPIPIPQPPRSRPTLSPQSCRSPLPTFVSPVYSPNPEDVSSSVEEELEDSLSELEEGIDVLMILERAYNQTLKAHVAPPTPPSTTPTPSPAPAVLAPFFRPRPDPAAPLPLKTGSSTALLAILDQCASTSSDSLTGNVNKDDVETVVKIAHVGDCMGMLVRGEEIIWRSEEMWWDFNTPVQLGPCPSSALPCDAHVFSFPVQADDILILASDGLSDNLWDEDILDEVVRFRRSFLPHSLSDSCPSACSPASAPLSDTCLPETSSSALFKRRTLAGMLSEALCSRARTVAERRPKPGKQEILDDEVPFARRAREHGKPFKGGKNDDISVIVAVISPVRP